MAASLQDAILFLQLILLLLPVIAALFQLTLRYHRENPNSNPRVVALGMFFLGLSGYFLAFAAWDVTAFIQENVQDGNLLAATGYIRFAVVLILVFVFMFAFDAIPEVENRSLWESIRAFIWGRNTSGENEEREENGDG